jgi:hypothetical protein
MTIPAGLCCLALLTSAAAWADELTLEQAVALAVKNNRPVTNARLEVEKFDHQIEVARTYWLPSFQLDVFEGEFLGPVNFVCLGRLPGHRLDSRHLHHHQVRGTRPA